MSSFLICRKKASAFQNFLNTKEQFQTLADQRSKGMQKQRRNSKKLQCNDKSRILVPAPQGIYMTVSLSSSAGTKAPPLREKMTIPGWTQNSWNLSLSSHHQQITKESHTHSAALTPDFVYKNFSLKTIREFGFFEHELPLPFVWQCNKSLLQTLLFQFVWPCCASGTWICVQ